MVVHTDESQSRTLIRDRYPVIDEIVIGKRKESAECPFFLHHQFDIEVGGIILEKCCQ
jgi:hypothetical protein